MSQPRKLKDPRTVRLFVSSPFGGCEREREELVARYFPQLTALCQAKGLQFVSVDLRWGITKEASSSNQVVNICLREIDRSDLFIGFYGQRYGFHGADDAAMQENISLALGRYPWLKKVRDRSATEFEFMHGFLNNPGALPAAFAFRHKSYDEQCLEKAKKANDEVLIKKYAVESAKAADLLSKLKESVIKLKAKALAVHEDYTTPEEAARLLFEDMKKHLETVILKDTKAQSVRDLELASHHAYMANRTSLYVGGQGYFKQLDAAIKTGGTGHLIIGPAGSGKAALLSNWLLTVKSRKTHEVVYHFVGCSKDSSDITDILKRLTEELDILVEGVKKPKGLEEREETDKEVTEDLSDLFQKLEVALDKVGKKKKTLVVISGLSRVQKMSRTSKPLFWLPVKLPKGVNLVVTCREDDTDAIQELTKNRGYGVTKMVPLPEKDQKEFCVKVLAQNSKELSPAQLNKIVNAGLSHNMLFLKIVTSELCSFGSFRLLDEKIDAMVKTKSIAELFDQFLGRLEENYNTTSDGKTKNNLIEQVMCSLTLSRKGLTETEVKDMFKVPQAAWSPLYFAIKDFLLDHSGLLRLAFEELQQAVEKRYLSSKAARDKYLSVMIDYFQGQRKGWTVTIESENASVARVTQELPWLLRAHGNKDGLIDVLTDTTVFARLFVDEEYELLELWRCTGRSGEQIAKLYLAAIDKQGQLMEKEAGRDGMRHVIDLMLLSHLDALTYFLEMGHFTQAQGQVLQRRLEMLEKVKGSLNEDRRQRMLSQVQLKLSYLHANTGRYQEAQKLQQDVLAYRKMRVEKTTGVEQFVAFKDLAVCFHAIGLLHSRVGDLDMAIENYQQAMVIHEKLKSPVEFADSMNNLGVMLMKRGNYEQAAEYCSRALKIYKEEYFGHLPPIIGVMIGNIAVCYRNLNRLDESEAMYKEAVDISERALGRNHPNVAAALTNLGTLEVNRGRFEDAEKHFMEALSIHKACVSPVTNTDLFKVREKYVYTVIKLKKNKEALEAIKTLYEQAVKGEHLGKAWPVGWAEVLSLLLAEKQAPMAANIAADLLKAGAKHDVIYTLLHKADVATKRKEPRPREMTLEYALEEFPKSPVLVKYQAEEMLIPAGNLKALLALLDKADQNLGAGADIYHAALGWCKEKDKMKLVPELCRHAADKFPDDTGFNAQMAQMLRDEEKYEEAAVYAQRLIKLRPDDPQVLLFAGEIFVRALDEGKARSSFEKVLKISKPTTTEYEQAKSALKVVDQIKQQASLKQAGAKAAGRKS